jgi:hypothetical protein
LEKTARTEEREAVKIAEVEEKEGQSLEGSLAAAFPHELTVLKIRLALTNTIDYPLPPVIGD